MSKPSLLSRLRAASRAARLAFFVTGPDVFTVGNSFAVRCAMNPADALVVSPGIGADVVAIQAINQNLRAPAVILLPAALARVFAAAVLNSADDIDGTARLNFVPDGPKPPADPAGVAA